ncbi:MAG: 16S rRNA (guanine(527)-N(7))-methyltransferase RsmG [Pseudohongiellaceae bacterium]
MEHHRFAALLDQGLDEAAITLDADQKDRLLEYLALLYKWNQAYNLTAVRDPEEMISRHLLDSLALLPHLDATTGTVLDVGTGPGLPGIPLAIARPQRRFILLDSNGKKTRFLFQVQLVLKLDTIHIVGERIEQYAPEPDIHVIVSRAFASLARFWSVTAPVWSRVSGEMTLLAMKAGDSGDAGNEQRELEQQLAAQVVPQWHCRSVPLTIPGSEAARQLVILQRTTTETLVS